jgi:hypothetical protein
LCGCQGNMKKVISASRRTDLVAVFPGWLSSAVKEGKARVSGPSGRVYSVDLRPESVHTFVLWSKNFDHLVKNRNRLLDRLRRYDQLYFHFTITGLGGSPIERNAPKPEAALDQIEPLIELAGRPERISLRFDPVIFWQEEGETRTNLAFFEKLASRMACLDLRTVRFSFAQWYGKSRRRAAKYDFAYVDPAVEEKKEVALRLSEMASAWGLNLYSCSQDFLAVVPGVHPSSCIDGRYLQIIHPSGDRVSLLKDKTQRRECGCTESVDIGSYTQTCPHSCLYCYANPRL